MINRLDGVCDAAEAFQIHVLVVPQHLCAGVSDKGQLVLVGGQRVIPQASCSINIYNPTRRGGVNNLLLF